MNSNYEYQYIYDVAPLSVAAVLSTYGRMGYKLVHTHVRDTIGGQMMYQFVVERKCLEETLDKTDK